ncbi:putative inosine-5'-monophosphate dehydrogenase related protein [Oryzomicrobium terrae]|uniref:Putative inosine-5'-monophosphate dehydrogenase related protein n=1 Tax=Oryzomicrobium terrae TaxID=1735038 RepID=A0A5C1E5Q1_9RHOO|nr:CBS domain-containing protein [Oryzomicrobium terrae]QEL64220.1 putative inosine-5'-monophosphate dehydrogenase related protein [Oryzomicrobium terrae]
MPQRTIRDVIRDQHILTTSEESTVRQAVRRMADTRVGAIMVIRGGLLVGIFTERDALNRVLAPGLDPDTTPITLVMTPEPRTVSPERPLGYALHLMHTGGFRHLPVVDNGRPVGMVSVRDALGSELSQFERELDDFEHIATSL